MYAVEPRYRYIVQSVTATSGSTVVVGPATSALWLNQSAVLATLTVQLPPSPTDGQFFVIGCAQAITALVFTGGTVKGVLASMAINSFARYVYSAADLSWFRAG